MKKLIKFLLTLYIILFPSLSWSSELFETLEGNPIFQFFLELLREMYLFIELVGRKSLDRISNDILKFGSF